MSGKRAAGSDKPSSSGRIRQTFYASPCHVAGPSEEPNTAADIGQRTSDAMPLAAENVGMPTPAFLQQRLSKRYGPDWQPNKPKDKGKQLTEVLSHVTHDMHWRRLQTIAEYAPPDAMFANMNWKQILDTVWLEAHTCAGGIAMMQGNPTAPAMSRGQSSSDAPVESVRVSVVNCGAYDRRGYTSQKGKKEWQEKVDKILQRLNTDGTELIMVQEVNDTLAEFRLPQGWQRLRVPAASRDKGISHSGCQILYREDTFTLIPESVTEVALFPELPKTDERWKKLQWRRSLQADLLHKKVGSRSRQ